MIELATAAIALVSPWLAKVGEGAAKKLGEKAAEAIGPLCGLVRDALAGDSLILLNLERGPTDAGAQEAAAKTLAAKMQADPKLAEEVGKRVGEVKKDPAVAQFLTQVYGGHVDKITNIHDVNGDVTF